MNGRTTCAVAIAAAILLGAGDSEAARTVQGVVNVNTATQVELDLLPGIGPKVAKRIIEFRQKQTYRSREDLLKVKGIGPRIFERVKVHLVVLGPTTLAVAGATRAAATPAKTATNAVRTAGQ